MGVVGIETAFAVLYTELVCKGILSLERLVEAMCYAPRRRFGITSDMGYTVFETEREYAIDPKEFLSMGRSTPFEGRVVRGRCLATVYNGKTVYASDELGNENV